LQVRIRIMQRVHGSAFPEGQVSRQSGHSAPGRLQIEGPAWNLRHGSTTAIDKFQNCIPAAGKVRSGLTGTDTPPQPPTGSPRRSSRFTATPRHQHPRSPRRTRPVGAKGSQLHHATNTPAAPDGLVPSERKVYWLARRTSGRTSTGRTHWPNHGLSGGTPAATHPGRRTSHPVQRQPAITCSTPPTRNSHLTPACDSAAVNARSEAQPNRTNPQNGLHPTNPQKRDHASTKEPFPAL